ncbi:MAG: spore germination protein [Clostridiales bacterium]|nr:spore germination protein [Clostridiales bacterium]
MNAEKLLSQFATESNIVTRKVKVGKTLYKLLLNTELTDPIAIRSVIKALELYGKDAKSVDDIKNAVLYVSEVEIVKEESEAMESLLSGDLLIFLGEEVIVVNVRKYDKRAIQEPPTETVMRGPREGFIEDLKTNLGLIERRLRTPALGIEKYRVGRVGSTTVALVYISTIASPDLIEEVRKRIKKIDIDCLLDSHYLQPLIEDHPFSIFQQTGVSEKPDVVCAKLLEGRVALIVDGSPMVITVPFMFIENLQSSEDYYERNAYSSFLRIMRLVALFFGAALPALFVAIQMFHQEVIPVRFLTTLMNAIEGIPLPPLPEILFVLLLFEIIREASVRMPRAVGMAMSIVGALVLGETAVNAGIISSPAVMVVALSSISLYTVPNEVGTMSLIRVIMIIMGGFLGFFGLIVSALFFVHRMCTLDSFGVPYTAPFAPFIKNDLKDSIIRAPLPSLKTRPESIPNINHVRQGDDQCEKM